MNRKAKAKPRLARPIAGSKLGRPASEDKGASVGVYVSAALQRQLDSRGANRSAIITRDLRRYFALLELTRRGLAHKFTTSELSDVASALAGREITPETMLSLPAVATTCGVRDSTAAKLDQLSPLELATLLDACERYNARPDHERKASEILAD